MFKYTHSIGENRLLHEVGGLGTPETETVVPKGSETVQEAPQTSEAVTKTAENQATEATNRATDTANTMQATIEESDPVNLRLKVLRQNFTDEQKKAIRKASDLPTEVAVTEKKEREEGPEG